MTNPITHIAILERRRTKEQPEYVSRAVIVPADQTTDFDEGAATRKWLWPYLGSGWHLHAFYPIDNSGDLAVQELANAILQHPDPFNPLPGTIAEKAHPFDEVMRIVADNLDNGADLAMFNRLWEVFARFKPIIGDARNLARMVTGGDAER